MEKEKLIPATKKGKIKSIVGQIQEADLYRELHWEGTF